MLAQWLLAGRGILQVEDPTRYLQGIFQVEKYFEDTLLRALLPRPGLNLGFTGFSGQVGLSVGLRSVGFIIIWSRMNWMIVLIGNAACQPEQTECRVSLCDEFDYFDMICRYDNNDIVHGK